MSTPTSYVYSIARDITSGALSGDRLQTEVLASSIAIAISHVETIGDTLTVHFKDALSIDDKTLLDSIVLAHSGIPLPQPAQLVSIETSKTSDNKHRVVIEKGAVTRVNFYTHNFCDPTTWYQQSVRIVNEIPTNTNNDLITYQLSHTKIIDTTHAKIVNEDSLKDSGGHSYAVTVTVNDVVVNERAWPASSGGDFTVNYATGTITFTNSLQVNDVVKVTYHYENGSRFTIAPMAGKKLFMQRSKACFSFNDVVMNDTVKFDIYGIADYFLTSAMMTALNITPNTGTKILLQGFTYKTMHDFIVDAHIIDREILAIGGGVNDKRGSTSVINFIWDYVSSTAVSSHTGMELRAYLVSNIPMSGTMCMTTFYANSETE